MDFEFIRFRIDPEIHQRAARACTRLGIDLNDVLRTLVTRVARDGALPFDVGAAPPPPAPDRTPFHDYDPRLWDSLKPQVDAEVALSLLARFVADCSTRIDDQYVNHTPDQALVERLQAQREEALRTRRALDVSDRNAIAGILRKYGQQVRVDSD
jgi:hypothetical protein